jgi:hypothetical protein
MSYPKIEQQNVGNNTAHLSKEPNVNFRLRNQPSAKQNIDSAMHAAEEQQKQQDAVNNYNKMVSENEINLLKQKNDNQLKVSNMVTQFASRLTNSGQGLVDIMKSAQQQIKQLTDNAFKQGQQKQQQEQEEQEKELKKEQQ